MYAFLFTYRIFWLFAIDAFFRDLKEIGVWGRAEYKPNTLLTVIFDYFH